MPMSIISKERKDAYCQFIDQSESSEVDMPEELKEVNNLQDLHSKYDLHIDTPSTEKNIDSKYESKTLELKDVGYGTDSGSKESKGESLQTINYDDGGTPMQNPYLKSLEKITKFKLKNKKQLRLPSINMGKQNITLPQINSHRSEV